MLSIVTPWKDGTNLIPDYERAVTGAQVIIIDNASAEESARAIAAMVGRLDGKLIVNAENRWFSAANNQGLAAADGEAICFLNSDVAGDGRWMADALRDVRPDGLYGPELAHRDVDGEGLPFIAGWCVAATRQTWNRLGGWDAVLFPHPYWEDNDLSLRAASQGMQLIRTGWPLQHRVNRTADVVPGALAGCEANRQSFIARVRARRGNPS